MRPHLLCLAGLLTACATSDAPAPEPEPVDIPAEAARAPEAPASRVIQLHYVDDLVEPPGDPERVAGLASEVRSLVTFALADTDRDAIVASTGSRLLVVGTPALQERVTRHLQMRRDGTWHVR